MTDEMSWEMEVHKTQLRVLIVGPVPRQGSGRESKSSQA
jgi:hypothetical protein